MNPELQQQTDLILKALGELDKGNSAIFFALCGIGLLLLALIVITISKK
jgi:hypothetical protein